MEKGIDRLHELSSLWLNSESNIAFQKSIEPELQSIISRNISFSREYLFERRNCIGISFIPTSEAFKQYGKHVTVKITFDPDEILEIGKNIGNIDTYGVLKAEVLKVEQEPSLHNSLGNISFHTSEILEVLPVSTFID